MGSIWVYAITCHQYFTAGVDQGTVQCRKFSLAVHCGLTLSESQMMNLKGSGDD